VLPELANSLTIFFYHAKRPNSSPLDYRDRCSICEGITLQSAEGSRGPWRAPRPYAPLGWSGCSCIALLFPVNETTISFSLSLPVVHLQLCGLHPAARRSPTHPGRRSPVKTASPPPRSKSPICSPATPRRAGGNRGPSKRQGTSPPPLTPASPRRHGSQRTGNQEVRGQRSGGPPRSSSSSSSEVSGYQRPTAASVSRALSPYTHRRMCELSEDARARLGHLQLGPHRFRKQTESQPPFLVGRRCRLR